jgi:hypothetical protein
MHANHSPAPADVLSDAKRLAATNQSTLTTVIEDALRETLARHRQKRPVENLRLRTYGKGGTLPGVEIDGSAPLHDPGTDAVD